MSFILSKLFWTFLSPSSCLTLLLVTGAFLGASHQEARRAVGRKICFIVALLFFFIGVLPVGAWSLVPLENRFPPQTPQHVDGIILLGGDEKPHSDTIPGRPVFLDSARRYIAFASMARQYPHAKLVFSGGSPKLQPNELMKDVYVAKQALSGLGVPVDKMIVDDLSRNTHENAVFSYNLVHPDPKETWLLVTSAFHMPRAMASFRKAGWNVVPATTGYLTDGTFPTHLQFELGEHLTELSWAWHEYYGLLAYWLMGYTDTLWPN